MIIQNGTGISGHERVIPGRQRVKVCGRLSVTEIAVIAHQPPWGRHNLHGDALREPPR